MIDSEHDTVDLREEVDESDDALATGSLAVAAEGRHVGILELALVSIANAIWAVVGLVLWLPQATRAVLTAALRTIHAALTHQSSSRAVAGIKRVSRSYVERFLHRQTEQAWVGRRHELRPFRLVGETTWAILFYLVVLRWLAPDRFASVWARMIGWAVAAQDRLLAVANQLLDWVVGDPGGLEGTRLQAGGVLLLVALIGAGFGFWLGRRR